MKRLISLILCLSLIFGIVLIPASGGMAGKEIVSENALEASSDIEASEDDEERFDEKAAKKITIKGSKYVAKGKKITLTAEISPKGASQKVTWKSGDKKIATVSSKGEVKGIKPGKVKITATSKANKKVQKTITIEVKEKAVTSVKITGAKDLDLAGTKTVTLKAKASPKKAAQSFEWTSSDVKIATVNEKGKVTAKKAGTVKITATATDGSKKKKTVTIQVTDSAAPTPAPTLPPAEVLTIEEAADSLADMIQSYDGSIPVVEGYEEYSLARLVISCSEELPDISAYSPAQIIRSGQTYYIIQFTNPIDAKNCAEYLNSISAVEFAEADQRVTCDSARPIFATKSTDSWGRTRIRADAYASYLRGKNLSSSVTVAVIDSGVDTTHPLIRSSVSGYDFYKDAKPHWHGTFVAGIIMDCTDGLDGIRIMSIRAAGEDGKGTGVTVGQGVFLAAELGADVINISMCGPHSSYIETGVRYALSKGITVVASAGNESDNVGKYCPAHIPGCITVSAMTKGNGLYSTSNYGDGIDLCAPGEDIKSAAPGGGYTYAGETSAAAPHVSAAAALLLYEHPGLSYQEVANRLYANARDLGNPGKDTYFGYGMVYLDGFIKPVPQPTPTPEIQPTPTPTPTPTPIPEDVVDINEANFPDANFRAALIDKTSFSIDWNTGRRFYTKEDLATVIELDISGNNISKLDGIEHFSVLQWLNCHSNNIQTLKVNNNKQLQYLDCSDNTALTYLKCDGNTNMRTLDISNCNHLIDAYKNGNVNHTDTGVEYSTDKAYLAVPNGVNISAQIVYLIAEANFPDESFRQYLLNNTSYTTENGKIYYTDTQIQAVKEINVENMQIQNIQGIEIFTSLEKLNCGGNMLTALDVSKNTALTELRCLFNQITELNINNNTALKILVCSANELKSLNISNNTVLEELLCRENQITSLTLGNVSSVNFLSCGVNKLTSLDLSQDAALEHFYCEENNLTSLNLSNNTALRDMTCYNNPLNTLTLGTQSNLEELDCYNAQLTNLDISKCPILANAYTQGERTEVNGHYKYTKDTGVLEIDKTVTVNGNE